MANAEFSLIWTNLNNVGRHQHSSSQAQKRCKSGCITRNTKAIVQSCINLQYTLNPTVTRL